jgi:hypothetical protein
MDIMNSDASNLLQVKRSFIFFRPPNNLFENISIFIRPSSTQEPKKYF